MNITKNSLVEAKGAEAKCITMFLAYLGWDKNEVHDCCGTLFKMCYIYLYCGIFLNDAKMFCIHLCCNCLIL